MAVVDRILIPTDFSDSSEKAYLLAEKLATAKAGRIDLLHTIPQIVFMDEKMRESSASLPDLNEDLYPHLFNEAELKLNKLMKDFFSYPVRGETYVKVDRKPAQAITDHAWDGNYSMIIMSARGKDASGMFRGSTTEKVLRTSKVPVLSVYSDPVTLESGTVVVPTDGSPLSMAAIPAAAQFAELFDASITFLHVHEAFGFFKSSGTSSSDRGKNKQNSQFLLKRLQSFITDNELSELRLKDTDTNIPKSLVYKNREIPIFFETITGFSAHHEITKYANRLADLVVMTTHGRSGLAHMILGSNAEKVALNVEKTVLTIRPDSKLFAKYKE